MSSGYCLKNIFNLQSENSRLARLTPLAAYAPLTIQGEVGSNVGQNSIIFPCALK